MPNTAGSPAADLSGSGGQAAVETPRSRDGGEHGLVNSLSRGASAAPGGSSSEGQRPRTCPVTHSREQFYTVCSDYALVNQAACLYHSSEHSAPAASLVQSLAEGQDHSSSSMTCEGDSAMEAVSASHTKPVLAWEIDTTDFDAVLIRMKSWTGNLKKTGSRKIKASDKHSRNLQEFPQQATLEEVKQRKVLDQRRWYCISRPQYKTSCGISSLVSCWNFLYSTLGAGSLPPITQEEALLILGFQPPFEEIKFGPFTGNATLMRWFRQINDNFRVRGCSYILYKPHGKNRTAGETAEGALLKLTRGLQDDSMAYIYHCQNHYFCPVGFEATPLKAAKAYRGPLPHKEVEHWILIGEPSRKHPAIHCKKWADIVTDLNTQNPEYLDIRHTERGLQYRKTKKVGGNLHCLLAFQRVNWQRLGPWALNCENLGQEIHQQVSARSGAGVSDSREDNSPVKHHGCLGRTLSGGFQKEWKRFSNTSEYISIWLNQALKGARDRDGNSVHNAHLLTLFNRLCKLLFFRIRPVFVFDGDAPLLKKQTLASRRQRKEEAVKESKETSEKLLKTFLKRQAIKAALGNRSQETLPSISNVRREEVDDMYVLPSLQDKELNSSEEEAEQEWEETATNRRIFQEEFFENPNAVDIDSEEFATLPAEVKHEILNEMKEFSKRRRTMFEAPPEKSPEFSQYQLSGLLKRNSLNQRIQSVQAELNQQSSGLLPAELSMEGGADSSVETRRLLSEDTSHYILITGTKKTKKTLAEKGTIQPLASTSKGAIVSAEPPLWHPAPNEEPPSPRTLRAIREAMQEEESASTATAPPSPRTVQAIQAAMESCSDEDVEVVDTKMALRQEAVLGSGGLLRQDIVLYSGDTSESRLLTQDAVLGSGGLSPRTLCAVQVALKDDSKEKTVKHSENNQQGVRKTILINSSDDEGTMEVICERNQASRATVAVQSTPAKEGRSLEVVHLEDSSLGSEKTDGNLEGDDHSQAADLELGKRVADKLLGNEKVSEISVLPHLAASNRKGAGSPTCTVSSEAGETPVYSSAKEETSKNTKQDVTLEDFSVIGTEMLQRGNEESDSEESFIEVSDVEEVEPLEEWFGTPHPHSAAEHIPNRAARQECAEEEAVNEWADRSLEELEELENNLYVQQKCLQAEKQQQERIAATVTGQMQLESQELLRLFGIPFIVAPMEAEAQCAVLDLTDQTSGTITDDSDIWLFGARHVYKNFFSQNKYVESYQYSDLQNQLGLDRSKLINLAYLLGSDYTEGVPGVGYVTGMEILNEFPGPGMEPLVKFRDWWTEAQKNKKMRPNPNDSKVKRTLRSVQLQPGFPCPAVSEAYLQPVVDDSQGGFFWGRPNLEEIKEFCGSRFGWNGRKTDELLLPVMKQLNAQQTQLRIDSFFRLEQHERQAMKSQRLRRAVSCMKRKQREEEEDETLVLEEGSQAPGKGKKAAVASKSPRPQSQNKDRKQPEIPLSGGGFLGFSGAVQQGVSSGEEVSVREAEAMKPGLPTSQTRAAQKWESLAVTPKEWKNSSSSSEESDGGNKGAMVTAKSVFENQKGKANKSTRARKRRRV
ncbi:DNA excision repair protein ERCC-5 homolog isoform X2 [Acipenser ruthenus]|uniref:DNA excision repair protein ERCC-5 homolog isoform X2 n=1 Tax=Acipenser ruthenus TaxID=7906 RepID=UPI0027427054|nr:DNA excision repair protein ERCC-5 homolog isoform X2 [Acipenser ruthenus]